MEGLKDLSKSERALALILYLGVLAALLFTNAPDKHIETWRLYAGIVVSAYIGFKSFKPNDTPKAAPEPVAPLVPGDDR